MVMTNYAPVVILIIAVIAGLFVYKTKFQKVKSKTWAYVFVGAIVVYALIGIASQMGYVSLGESSGYFLTATPVAVNVVENTNTNVPNVPVAGEKAVAIGTLSVISTEKNSNSNTAVAGTLKIFNKDVDPSNPTASALDSITITAGVGSSTNKYVKTGTQYRVVFDGDGTYYDKDFGVMVFQYSNYNPSTGDFLFELGDVTKVATIDDMMDESSASGIINGQTASNVSGTAELGFTSADSLMYDKSVGDGQFYVQPTISFSSAYTEVKDAVLCFEWDTTNAPEGNEITSIVYQLVSGSDFGIVADELVNYWSNEECLALGSQKAGTSSTIKLTFTVAEANLDGNDDWYLALDDLGSLRGKDINLDSGATLDRVLFDAQE